MRETDFMTKFIEDGNRVTVNHLSKITTKIILVRKHKLIVFMLRIKGYNEVRLYTDPMFS